ncbi:RrF2 family transcriptional regulator [Psychroflexus salis]|uniref:Rrf2 family transcriptional regulator n=1 Tax=Psychroflexus salis TaxID=1526574 RepID=A0A916ZRC5_9FLAO|nr:Rrf2 family transcriptional regulator [Psychroflexus salis]GGE07679.1 Rrf2 family transcriptional regulator [Psychroflexus salis]
MLSKKTKYAINALVYLAKKKDKTPTLISEIAEKQNIPQKFLEAILLNLKRDGVLASKRGKGGGYYLLKKPEDVNLAEVMRLFDGPIAFIPCVTHHYYEACEECTNESICGIRDIFFEVRNKTVEILKRATLEEIITRENLLNPDY